MASRRKGRILAFQALYFWESSARNEPPFRNKTPSRNGTKSGNKTQPQNEPQRVPLEELVSFDWLDEEKQKSLDEEGTAVFARALIAGTLENVNEIDKLIRDHLENWDISRLKRVDLAVLRMSVYSLMFQSDISPPIVIDEAIGICREFGTDDSYKFVNGVLDSIRKTIQGQK